jgi:hypothetical protein
MKSGRKRAGSSGGPDRSQLPTFAACFCSSVGETLVKDLMGLLQQVFLGFGQGLLHQGAATALVAKSARPSRSLASRSSRTRMASPVTYRRRPWLFVGIANQGSNASRVEDVIEILTSRLDGFMLFHGSGANKKGQEIAVLIAPDRGETQTEPSSVAKALPRFVSDLAGRGAQCPARTNPTEQGRRGMVRGMK